MSMPVPSPFRLRPGALDVPAPDVDPMRWGGAAMDKTDFLALSRVSGYKYKLLDGTLTEKTHPSRYPGSVARVL